MVDAKSRIMAAAIEGVRIYGLDGVRVQHISKLAGTASSNIYGYFGGKDELLRACFEQVDTHLARIFVAIRPTDQEIANDPEGVVRKLWTAYYRWLVAHPDETVFYHRYRDSAGFLEYERSRDFSHFAAFIDTIRRFNDQYHLYDQLSPRILWLHLLTVTVMYAKQVAEGELPNDRATEERIFRLILHGLNGLFQAGETPRAPGPEEGGPA